MFKQVPDPVVRILEERLQEGILNWWAQGGLRQDTPA